MTPTSILGLFIETLFRLIRIPYRVLAASQEFRKKRRCTVERLAVLLETSRIENLLGHRDAIFISAGSQIAGQLLVFGHGGQIRIGIDCYIGEGTRIWSANSILIGNRVLISHDVNVHDTNAHSLSAQSRHRHFREIFTSGYPREIGDVPDSPIVIEDDVWIGFGAVILKGVCLGRGSIIGAAAVVCGDVPPYSIVVGNPARVVGEAQP